MQEVFVRALAHLKNAPDDAEAMRWIYRISTNYCLSVLRKRSVRESGKVLWSAGQPPAPDAAARMDNRLVCLAILGAIEPRLAEPAALYHLDELDQGTIATMLGVTRRTVINRLAEFARRARDLIEGKGS